MESYKICDHYNIQIGGSFVNSEQKKCNICNIYFIFFGDKNYYSLVINIGYTKRITCYNNKITSDNNSFNNLQEAIDFNIKYLNNIIFE